MLSMTAVPWASQPEASPTFALAEVHFSAPVKALLWLPKDPTDRQVCW